MSKIEEKMLKLLTYSYLFRTCEIFVFKIENSKIYYNSLDVCTSTLTVFKNELKSFITNFFYNYEMFKFQKNVQIIIILMFKICNNYY